MDNDKLHAPLVSIIVITYNAEKFVSETLNSIKAQTYDNIELIISDDSSIDNTVLVCKKWIEDNKTRFIDSKIIISAKNTGIPSNCNRGVKAAKGKWIKLIAGDDALLIDCIKNNIDFASSNPNINFVFSDTENYRDNFQSENLILDDGNFDIKAKKFTELSSEFQLKVLARGSIVKAPTMFINRKKLQSIGGFDEHYPFLEDWTTYHNWLLKGFKIYYLPKKTVKYRVSGFSIQNEKTNNVTFSSFTIKLEKVFKDYFFQYYTLKEKVLFFLEYAYYKYYFFEKNINFFQKIIQRVWYLFVKLSIKERKKALDKYYKIWKR